jgi:hypothetical protein
VFAPIPVSFTRSSEKDREILGTSNKLGSFLSKRMNPQRLHRTLRQISTTSWAGEAIRFKRIEHKIRLVRNKSNYSMPGVKGMGNNSMIWLPSKTL